MSDTKQEVELTVLGGMGSRDFDPAADQFARWGPRWIDGRGEIYGKPVADLDAETAGRAAATIERAGLRAYCLSTLVFNDCVERGGRRLLPGPGPRLR